MSSEGGAGEAQPIRESPPPTAQGPTQEIKRGEGLGELEGAVVPFPGAGLHVSRAQAGAMAWPGPRVTRMASGRE